MKMDLNKLRDRAYKTACEHGFHEKEYSDAHWLMLVITEIAEAVQADRNNLHADLDYFRVIKTQCDDSYFGSLFEQCVKDSVEDELADVIIRLLDFAGLKEISFYGKNTIKNMDCNFSKLTFSEFCYFICGFITDRKYSLDVKIETSIYILIRYCNYKSIDLFQHIEWKMRYNELRPFKNGKEY